MSAPDTIYVRCVDGEFPEGKTWREAALGDHDVAYRRTGYVGTVAFDPNVHPYDPDRDGWERHESWSEPQNGMRRQLLRWSRLDRNDYVIELGGQGDAWCLSRGGEYWPGEISVLQLPKSLPHATIHEILVLNSWVDWAIDDNP